MRMMFRLLVLFLLATALSACQAFVPQGGVLFSDDFSDPYHGWTLTPVLPGGSSVDATGDMLQFVVNTAQSDYWSTPGLTFSDVRLEVDAAKQAGPEINRIGVICRYQDPQNFYFFIFSSDGFFSLGKTLDGQVSLLGMDQMQRADVILPGAQLNHLRADCVGETLTFFVNGRQVASVVDDSFSKGDVGLLAGTFDEPGLDVLFDNFFVLKP